MSKNTKLSDRLRPNVECAPWVIDEVKKLENEIDQWKGTELEHARRVELLSQFQSAVSSCARYHTEYMGKEMPDREYESFKRLRDETIPRLRAELIAALTQGIGS